MPELARFHALDGQSQAPTAGATLENMDADGERRKVLSFNQSTIQSAAWDFPLTRAPSGGIELRIDWATAATSGNVQWRARIEAKSPGATLNQNTSTSYAGDNVGASQAVEPGAYRPATTVITITNTDNWQDGDNVRVQIDRNTGVGGNASSPALFTQAVLTDGN